ncbi:MAG TPA: photosynthetic reaction center cytochrome c subunit family protein [Candidatus Binatia bacterium]|nr:photosynthetic reaction center cytochrome c subunit family protein [Candidatus Binatia bacterium]
MSLGKRVRILITLAVFLCAMSLTLVSRAKEAAFTPQGTQAERTFKNIQVLKGLPEGELYQTMNFIAVSLGENCTFCHVTNGRDPKTNQINWVWESDDKGEKQTARRMLQMVLLINGSNKVDFGPNAVTCHTCHRGQRTPEGLPSMPLAKSGHEGLLYPAPLGPAAPRPRPSVDEIFAHYVQAIGPKAAATKTLIMKGTRLASQNRNWPNEIIWSAPDKFLSVMTLPQTTIRQAVAGDAGWVLNGTKLQTLAAAQTTTARRGLEEVFSAVKVTQAPGMQSAGIERIDGRDMWVVERSTPETTLKYYFDAETGLLRRRIAINHHGVLPLPEQTDFEDYRDVDGVKLPFIIRRSAIDTYDSWTRTFAEIKRNVAVADALFAPPAVQP